jgi:hypothetical protein
MQHLRAAGGQRRGSGDLIVRFNTPFAQPIEKVYRVGPVPQFTYEMNTFDHYAILQAIRKGKQNADLAAPEQALGILRTLQDLSKVYGTKITIGGSGGVIRP